MDLSLVMFKADGTRRDFPIKKDRVVIGRKPTCDLRIPLSSVSREHCEIRLADGKASVRDLGSSNGTLHNSGRVQEHALAAGDELTIGPVVFTVVIDGEPAEIEPIRSLVEQEAGRSSPAGGSSASASGAGKQAVDEPGDEAAAHAAHASDGPGAEDDSDVYELADADEPLGSGAQAALETDADPLPVGSDDDAQSEDIDFDDPLAALERMAAEEQDADDDAILALDDDDEADEPTSTGSGGRSGGGTAPGKAGKADDADDIADVDELGLLSDDDEPDQGKKGKSGK